MHFSWKGSDNYEQLSGWAMKITHPLCTILTILMPFLNFLRWGMQINIFWCVMTWLPLIWQCLDIADLIGDLAVATSPNCFDLLCFVCCCFGAARFLLFGAKRCFEKKLRLLRVKTAQSKPRKRYEAGDCRWSEKNKVWTETSEFLLLIEKSEFRLVPEELDDF